MEDIKRLDDIKDILQGNISKQQEKIRRRMKHGAAKPALKVGDKVWRQNVRSQQRKGGKLEPNFLGPFTVVALQGKSADLLAEGGTVINNVNVDHLQLAKVEQPRIPHKIGASLGPVSAAPTSAAPATTAGQASPASTPPAAPASTSTSPAPYTLTSAEKCRYYDIVFLKFDFFPPKCTNLLFSPRCSGGMGRERCSCTSFQSGPIQVVLLGHSEYWSGQGAGE